MIRRFHPLPAVTLTLGFAAACLGIAVAGQHLVAAAAAAAKIVGAAAVSARR